MEDKLSIPEEYSAAMNKVLSYELHISDAYLSMACNSIDESVQPSFATFFEDQANVKRENGKKFLEYLGKCGNKICLPVFKRPEIDYWGTGISALECALELEDQLTKLLMDLKTTASAKKERDVLEFTGKYLKGQKKSTKNLQIKIGYCKEFEKQALKEKKPAEELGTAPAPGSLAELPQRHAALLMASLQPHPSSKVPDFILLQDTGSAQGLLLPGRPRHPCGPDPRDLSFPAAMFWLNSGATPGSWRLEWSDRCSCRSGRMMEWADPSWKAHGLDFSGSESLRKPLPSLGPSPL
ncbi:hypothetical protein QTO34_003339 [Cnephaeus nilssonii]|uniref:Ferritin n=1 Tax=Cnephaeus nilssonii TaxID=3371016 RepID=A0AA40LL77_CNENI|nr:hypothetical protein QTO34_003339 [Eptesicus nilssonii]